MEGVRPGAALVAGAKRVAMQYSPRCAVPYVSMVDAGTLSLRGLITHRERAEKASDAYRVAFNDPYCLKMILNWRHCS